MYNNSQQLIGAIKKARVEAKHGDALSEENYEPPEYGPDVCSLTGIDEWCCPCGRHE